MFCFLEGLNRLTRSRILGHSWFPQEVATQKHVYELDEVEGKIDIVISHTCPTYISEINLNFPHRQTDPTKKILDYILTRFRPSLWYFGHYHYHIEVDEMGCHFVGLDMCRELGCWQWLSGE